ncbi:MAG: hypothetical protein IJ156_04805 [Bacteroidales bacterium]|nr:hypothetical protein [Bacteroidales bacterium]
METAIAHRKLIDIKPAVFEELSLQASGQGVSLKRYIENLLEEACVSRRAVYSPGISRLIGSAIPKGKDLSAIKDDRFQYLLSK